MSDISPTITVATLGRVWAVASDLGVSTVLGWVPVGCGWLGCSHPPI